MATSRSIRSSEPLRVPPSRPAGGGRHRFTSDRMTDVLTPIARDWSTRRPADARDGSAWASRALRTLAGMMVVTWAFRLSGYLTIGPWLAVPVVILGLTGLLAIIAAWLPEAAASERRQRRADWLVLIAALVALAVWSYFQIFLSPDYGTDEIAFDQYAAQLAVHGLDPYLHSMAAAFPMFHVSPDGYTFRLDGRPITSLSYPALSFEAYMPLIAAGLKTQAAVWADVAAWAISGIVLFTVLPRRLAPLAAVIISLDVYIGYAVGGITDFLFVPLLAGAAVRWDRFAATRGPAAWRGPVLLGLALAVKQTPWLIVPFVAGGIVLEARRTRGGRRAALAGGRYLGLAGAAFLAPNLPYLVRSPGAWLHGVLTPFLAQAVPAGQGLISLSLSLAVGGGSLRAYTLGALVVLVVTLICYLTAYPLLKPAAFLLPSVVLFFGTRAFGSYLVMLIPAAVVAAATVARPVGVPCWRHWRWVAGAGLLACAASVTVALTATSPLAMSIKSVRTTGQLATIERLGVLVTNRSGSSVRPAFTVEDGTTTTAFWQQTAGPAVLGPHRTARYIIEAPSYFAMPSIGTGFQVLAFTQHPGTVSRTASYMASQWRVVLQPSTISRPVAPGQDITVRAQILNRLDQPMHVGQVPVYLGQVIYAQRGLQFSQAFINQGYGGETPVQALTNARGVATFVIHSPVQGTNPVYFEANLVRAGAAYPYGYSPILSVKFQS